MVQLHLRTQSFCNLDPFSPVLLHAAALHSLLTSKSTPGVQARELFCPLRAAELSDGNLLTCVLCRMPANGTMAAPFGRVMSGRGFAPASFQAHDIPAVGQFTKDLPDVGSKPNMEAWLQQAKMAKNLQLFGQGFRNTQIPSAMPGETSTLMQPKFYHQAKLSSMSWRIHLHIWTAWNVCAFGVVWLMYPQELVQWLQYCTICAGLWNSYSCIVLTSVLQHI